MMDRLYTPWRFAYVTGQIKEEGCVFCNCLQGDDQDNFILHRAGKWYIVLNRYPYNNGHLLLVLNRHQPALAACTTEEMTEMAALLPLMEQALQQAYNPHGINCGYNGGASAGAGIPEHLHLHMLPRWQGDTSFMTTIGKARVMPETLAQTYATLRPVLANLLAAER
jgi:ATP adenylyltransferase